MIFESKKENDPIDMPSRRLIKALFNGGIPSKLFGKFAELLVSKTEDGATKFLKEDDFGKTALNLGLLDSEEIDYENLLEQPLDSLKHHLLSSSNEATLRALFWDPILNLLFLHGQEGKEKNFRLSSEWRTQKLFPYLEDRKVDFEASIKPGTKRYPIFIVEAGTEPFDQDNLHKDYSKLIETMSLTCISMARDLLDLKKKPENARVYGMWIGELKCQLVVAHPVLTQVKDGTYEIHSEITYEDEWYFDLLSESAYQVTSTGPAESLTPGRIYNQTYEFIEFQLRPEISEYISEHLAPKNQDPVSPQPKIANVEEEIPLYRGNFNFIAIKRLHAFIEIIKSRIDLIMNEVENLEETRQLPPESHFGFIEAARRSTTKQTPPHIDQIKRAQAAKRGAIRKASQPKFIKTKSSFKELEIIRKLTLFPGIFTKLYSVEVDENNNINYIFEKMLPIVNNYNSKLSKYLCSVNPMESLYFCIRFGVNCLMSLHLLHDQLGIVHSDISSGNIMFSFQDGCWKIIDFDQSLEIMESLETPRAAGTRGFIAPESQETGIFSTKSDIYSLGKVIMDYLMPLLTHQILLDETDQVGPQERLLLNRFNRIAFSMITVDPESRPSAIEALGKMFELFKYFEYDTQASYFVAIESTLALHKTETEKEPKRIEQTVKKLKLSEEKEQKISHVSLSVQKNVK